MLSVSLSQGLIVSLESKSTKAESQESNFYDSEIRTNMVVLTHICNCISCMHFWKLVSAHSFLFFAIPFMQPTNHMSGITSSP